MRCEELRGSFELYVLGLLDQPEKLEIDDHLGRSCPNCTAELQKARELNSMFFAQAPAAEPSPKLRRRVLASVGVEERRGFAWAPWAGLAAAAAFAMFLFVNLDQERGLRARERTRMNRMQQAIALLTEPETRQVAFGAGPQGRVLANPRRGVLFIANNLPPAGAGKTYELWIIPKGGAPRPAGLFQSEDGSAMHLVEGPIDLANTGAFAVSVEPEAGSQAPTTTPIIIAPLAD